MKLDLSNSIDKQRATTYIGKLMDKEAKIELKEVRPKRSLNQNSYLHVCFSIIALETGYSLQEAKTVLKRAYGDGMVYEKHGQKFLRSTADLDSLEMTHFIDWLRSFALDQFDCYIPTSEEYLENQFMVDKEIERVR